MSTKDLSKLPRWARFEIEKLRADARATLKRNGYSQCGRCSRWHNEEQAARAFGSAHDPRCPHCGGTEPVED